MIRGISGYVPIKNNFLLDYTAHLAVRSLLPLCDEVLVIDAGSTDGTLEYFRLWQQYEPKIRIVHYELPPLPTPAQVEADDLTRPKGDPRMLIKWLNHGRAECRYDWQITLDADEVLHEQSHNRIRQAHQEGTPLWFNRVNFWGSPSFEAPHGTVCGERVVRCGPTSLEMCSDEPRPEGEPPIRQRAMSGNEYTKIFHLGFLRRQEAFLLKSRIVQAQIHNTFDPRLRQAEKTGQSWVDLSPFPPDRPLLSYPHRDWPDYVTVWLKDRGYLNR